MPINKEDQTYIDEVKQVIREVNEWIVANDDYLACAVHARRYDRVPPDIADRILGLPEFEVELETCNGDFSKWFLLFTKKVEELKMFGGGEEIYKCRELLIEFHPEYVEQFDRLLLIG